MPLRLASHGDKNVTATRLSAVLAALLMSAQFMMLHATPGRITRHIVGMHIRPPRGPSARPRMIVDDHGMIRPAEPRESQAPRRECRTNCDPAAESNRSPDEKSRPRRREHD